MPWKWIVCGWWEALRNVIRSRSPSRQRSVGPGIRWLYVQPSIFTPGAISISFSTAYSSHSRSTRPLASRRVCAPVEVAQQLVRVEAVGGVVDGLAAAERRVPAVAAGAAVLVLGGLRLVLPGMAVRHRLVEQARACEGT